MTTSASKPILVLVTGATAGIGYYTSYHLAQRGYHVLFGCRTLEKGHAAIEKLKAELPDVKADSLEPFVIDIDDDASIESAARNLESSYGYLDILVNNAAISKPAAKDFTPREKFRAVLTTNVAGTNLVIEALVPLIRKSTAPAPGRRIVNVSSGLGSLELTINGTAPIQPEYFAYSTSKAALNLLTNFYVHLLRDDKIAVVTGSPGFCATNLNAFKGFKAPKQGALEMLESSIIQGDFDSMHGRFFEGHAEYPW